MKRKSQHNIYIRKKISYFFCCMHILTQKEKGQMQMRKRKKYYHKTIVVRGMWKGKSRHVFSLLLVAVVLCVTVRRVPLKLERDTYMKAFDAVFMRKTDTVGKKNFYDRISVMIPAVKATEGMAKKHAAKYGGVKKEANIKAEETEPPQTVEGKKVKPIDMSSKGITFRNETAYTPDADTLLKRFQPFGKESDGPKVLIIHTHTSEAYADSDNARTTDNGKNVVRVGQVLAETLERHGISVVHDTTQNDYPSYNGSYSKALSGIREQLKKHPTIEVVLDVHRDYAEQTKNGETVQLKPVTEVAGEAVAQIMFVVGTDARGLAHPDWQDNLSFAVTVQQELNLVSPRIARPVNLRRERFNQHMTRGSLILEVGTAGNNLVECERAAVYVGNAVATVLKK